MSSTVLRQPDRSLSSEINITPLVDVLLVLLVIFMIVAPVVTGRILLPLTGGDPPDKPPAVLELTIAGDGQVTTASGVAVSLLELRAEMVMYAAKDGPVSLTLRPSADTPHQRIVDLLSMARESQLTNIAIERPR